MADFDAQPVWDGVGNFHLNRYRIAFAQPAGWDKKSLAADFVGHFKTYLDSPYATTELSSRTFNGKSTYKFWGALKLLRGRLEGNPDAHHDWVVLEWADPRKGQTAQTLCRNFFDSPDDAIAASGGAVPGAIAGGIPLGPLGSIEGATVGAVLAVEINRKHFLSGRRSWLLDDAAAFGQSQSDFLGAPRANILILETVAVERFAHIAFMAGDWIVGLEQRIPNIWISNLENFVMKRGLTPVPIITPQPADIWQKTPRDWVRYYSNNTLADFGAVAATKQFADMLPLYRTILPPRP